MEKHWPLVVMVAALAAIGLAAFAFHRWRQRLRIRGIKAWVEGYLGDRFGGSLERLTINASDDLTWPVLVGFDDVQTGTRHRLRFCCMGPPSTYCLESEQSEPRMKHG
jgi:hypothetical protein